MNKKELIVLGIIIILVIGISCFLLFTRKKEEKKIESIKSLHFSYSTSYMANANVEYELNEKDGKYKAFIKPNAKTVEETKEVSVDKSIVDDIIEMLNKYDVISWNGFQKYDQDVLDGNSFLFYLYTKDNIDIKASGYMMWPKNYEHVKDELDRIFDLLYDGMETM